MRPGCQDATAGNNDIKGLIDSALPRCAPWRKSISFKNRCRKGSVDGICEPITIHVRKREHSVTWFRATGEQRREISVLAPSLAGIDQPNLYRPPGVSSASRSAIKAVPDRTDPADHARRVWTRAKHEFLTWCRFPRMHARKRYPGPRGRTDRIRDKTAL